MSWWRRAPTDDKLDRELRFHLEQHARDLIARGSIRPRRVDRRRLAIGGVDQVKEDCRDERSTRWLSDVAQDARYALRLLRHSPGFAAVTLITLALGTGATTVMFTVIDGVLLKPLPFAAPHELVAVSGQTPTWNTALFGQQRLANLDFRDCQTREPHARPRRLALGHGHAQRAGRRRPCRGSQRVGEPVSGAGRTRRARTRLRRGRRPAGRRAGGRHQRPDLAREVRRVAGRRSARALVLDTRRYTVVGVMPPRFEIECRR